MSSSLRKAVLSAAVGCLGLVTAAQAAPIATIDFDTGYTGGEAFSAVTNNGEVIEGALPNRPTDFAASAGTWTATVTPTGGAAGNYLLFNILADTQFGGRLEAFGGTGSTNTGTIHFAYDYTRLTNGGGPVMDVRLLGNYGDAFVNNIQYLDAYVGNVTNVTFTTGQTYHIDTIVDLDAKTYQAFVDTTLVSQGTSATLGGNWFSGAQLNFGWSSGADRSFAIDNLVAGAVPEPTSLGLVAIGALALLRRQRAR